MHAPDFPFLGTFDAAIEALPAGDSDMIRIVELLAPTRQGADVSEFVQIGRPIENAGRCTSPVQRRIPPLRTGPRTLNLWVPERALKFDFEAWVLIRLPLMGPPLRCQLEVDHQVDLPHLAELRFLVFPEQEVFANGRASPEAQRLPLRFGCGGDVAQTGEVRRLPCLSVPPT